MLQVDVFLFCIFSFCGFIGLRSLAGSIKFEVNYLLWDIQRCVILYTPAVPPLRMMAGFVLGIGCIDTVLNFRINLGRDRYWVPLYLPTSEKASCWSVKRWRRVTPKSIVDPLWQVCNQDQDFFLKCTDPWWWQCLAGIHGYGTSISIDFYDLFWIRDAFVYQLKQYVAMKSTATGGTAMAARESFATPTVGRGQNKNGIVESYAWHVKRKTSRDCRPIVAIVSLISTKQSQSVPKANTGK